MRRTIRWPTIATMQRRQRLLTALVSRSVAAAHPSFSSAIPRAECLCDCDMTHRKTRRWTACRPLPATWRTAFAALRRNKMRAGLSALGVIIAVAAVIAMTEIGQGSKADAAKGIASMGANTIMIFAGATNNGGVNIGAGSAVTLTPQDAKEIARQCPAVCSSRRWFVPASQIVCGNRNCVPENIYGTTPSYLEVRDWKKMAAGRDVQRPRRSQQEQGMRHRRHHRSRTCSRTTSPIGKEIRINNVSFRVIGVLEPQGREHDGHGPGQHRAGPLDHGEVSASAAPR